MVNSITNGWRMKGVWLGGWHPLRARDRAITPQFAVAAAEGGVRAPNVTIADSG